MIRLCTYGKSLCCRRLFTIGVLAAILLTEYGSAVCLRRVWQVPHRAWHAPTGTSRKSLVLNPALLLLSAILQQIHSS